MSAGTRLFRPRVYGDPLADGSWAGWVVFFPVAGGVAIAPPSPETTPPSLAALEVWAAGLRDVYLEGALERALRAAQERPVIAHLIDAEYPALEDAARLESAADLERRPRRWTKSRHARLVPALQMRDKGSVPPLAKGTQ